MNDKQFTFLEGAFEPRRRITVTAQSAAEASIKVRGLLDELAEKMDVEPPVAWTLELVSEDIA
jgi:hypothetical protein